MEIVLKKSQRDGTAILSSQTIVFSVMKDFDSKLYYSLNVSLCLISMSFSEFNNWKIWSFGFSLSSFNY